MSVITTVFNGERFIEACVRSVTAETDADVEMVIVSDGSTDATDGILGALEDERVVTRVGPRRGRGPALNEAVALSRGRYLAVLDADDLCLPGRFRSSVDHLDAHPEIVLVGSSQWVHIDEEGTELGRRRSPARTDGDIRRLLAQGVTPFPHSSVMMRREALAAVGGYDEDLVHSLDLDLFIRMTGQGHLAALPSALAASRRHDGQFYASRQGDSGSFRRRTESRRMIDRRRAAAFGTPTSSTRAVLHEVGATAYWNARRLMGPKPVLPERVRTGLERRRLRPTPKTAS